jgi:hypothetical protein
MTQKHLDFATVKEEFNVYKVENGQILRAKQIVTDIIETTEGNKRIANLALRDVSVVITDVKINTDNFEISSPDKVTEKDQITELKFKPIREVINIYETPDALLFLANKVQRVFLTNKKDQTGAPILRYETLTGFNFLNKDTLFIHPPTLSPILNESQVKVFSDRFLCELCRETGNVIEKNIRSRTIFDKLKLGAFDERAIPQVIDEIIQDLIYRDLVAFGNSRDEIGLTQKGLEKCEGCRD